MSKLKSGPKSKSNNDVVLNHRSKSSRNLVELSSDEDNKLEDCNC